MLLSTSDHHTKDEIIEAPADGKRYEVVWGELLVTSKVSFAHQGAILDILVPLAAYCERYRLGEAWTPDARFPTIETEQLTWHPPGAAEPLIIPVASLFAER